MFSLENGKRGKQRAAMLMIRRAAHAIFYHAIHLFARAVRPPRRFARHAMLCHADIIFFDAGHATPAYAMLIFDIDDIFPMLFVC